jgi:hypothetical protein
MTLPNYWNVSAQSQVFFRLAPLYFAHPAKKGGERGSSENSRSFNFSLRGGSA